MLLGGATALLPVLRAISCMSALRGLGQCALRTGSRSGVWSRCGSFGPPDEPQCRRQDAACRGRLWRRDARFRRCRGNSGCRWCSWRLLGAADMISVFIRSTLVQLNTPDELRGRVSAISGVAISASNELGEMQSGIAASLLGATGAVVFGGAAAIFVTVIYGHGSFPEIRRARTFATAISPEGAIAHEGRQHSRHHRQHPAYPSFAPVS